MNAKAQTPASATPAAAETTLLQRIDGFLQSKERILLPLNLALTFLLGLMLFDARLSFATDDATYIQNALAWNERGSYPAYQGALYPFFLSVIIKLFGVKILLLKTCSLFFLVGHNFFLHKALRGRVPALLLWGALFTAACNAYILAYGSSTFSEAFYLCMQALALWSLFALIEKLDGEQGTFHWKNWLLFGFAFFLLSLAKNVSMFAIVAVAVYFLSRKQWKFAAFAVLAFLVFKAPYEGFVRGTFPPPGENQSAQLMRRATNSAEFNSAATPKEELDGYIDRLLTNYDQYISIHTFKILGFRSNGVPSLWTYDKLKELGQDGKSVIESNLLLGLLFLVLVGFALLQSYKRNKYVFYLILHTGAMVGVTFLALQTFWNQDRLMIIFIPFILLILAYAIYSFGQMEKYKAAQIATPIFMGLCLLLQLGTTLKAMGDNKKGFKALQKGDPFLAYPEDVRNFARLSRWTGENLRNDTLYVISGRPIESSVFSGSLKPQFSRMASINSQNLDTIYADFRKRKWGYFLSDARSQVGQMVGSLYQADSTRLRFIRQEGEMEPAMLMKIVK